MAADPYTTRQSVVKRLALGSIASASGLVASSLAGSDVITLEGHGFETDDPVTVRAVESGSLSAPLVAGTTYYAIRVSNAEFRLAATAGGSAINLTTDAVSMFVMREPDFDYWIGFYSRWADSSLPGHLVPLGRTEPVHPLVEGIVADLVAKRMFNIGGQASETVNDMEVASLAVLARFAAGLPLRGAPATAPANLAVTARAGSSSDPRGWGSGCLP
jgi:hypothetical protein